jgi:hypothetical protein
MISYSLSLFSFMLKQVHEVLQLVTEFVSGGIFVIRYLET